MKTTMNPPNQRRFDPDPEPNPKPNQNPKSDQEFEVTAMPSNMKMNTELSQDGNRILTDLQMAFQKSLCGGKDFSAADVLQATVQFSMFTCTFMEQLPSLPPEYRTQLQQNLNLNFDVELAKKSVPEAIPLLAELASQEANGFLGNS
jgi:hypothetical protein